MRRRDDRYRRFSCSAVNHSNRVAQLLRQNVVTRHSSPTACQLIPAHTHLVSWFPIVYPQERHACPWHLTQPQTGHLSDTFLSTLQLFPYHLSDYVCRVLRYTPFKYYSDIMLSVLKVEKSYDRLPNFTVSNTQWLE